MIQFDLNRKPLVFLQIKDHVIRLLQVKGNALDSTSESGEFFLEKGIIENGKVADKEKFTDVFKTCAKKWDLKRRKVIFLVPEAALFFRKLTIPSTVTEQDVRGYLNFEIGNSIHLPFDDPYFDFHILDKQNDHEIAILLFAVPEQVLKSYENELAKYHCQFIRAEISALRQFQWYQDQKEVDKEAHYLLVDWHLSSIHLSIFHNDVPIFMREQSNPFNEDIWQISENASVVVASENDQDVLIDIENQLKEIERVLHFYQFSLNQGKAKITNILLTGDHPYLKKIKKEMSQFNLFTELLEDSTIELPLSYLGLLSAAFNEVKQ